MYLPTIKLPSKAAVFGLARKELGHDLLGKELAISDDESTTVGQPGNAVRVALVCQEFHQSLRENFSSKVVFLLLVVVVRAQIWITLHFPIVHLNRRGGCIGLGLGVGHGVLVCQIS